MARGFCSVCKQEIGGFMKPPAYRCPSCSKLYCESCGPKVGMVFKKPTCPNCGVELRKT